MRNFIFLVFLALLPLPALAGSDAAEAYVTGVSGSQGSYRFAVRQTGRTIRADGCTQYRVRITPPQRTFWDKLNIGTGGLDPSHPTAEQTRAAVLLQRHASEQKPLQIGYLGSRLAPDPPQKCLYHGTGMAVEASDTVMVYQDGREGLCPYLSNP
ncbi:hypothetical protein [Eikenella corrodens]|uniref:Secreted protein n=1 Tax=Eikenella corrodens TaxID=539 RepID=A0A3S9SMG2_EIKCO|nr:hypothetical protein [Eikenella corrodens]AZR60672.1 hypothetical protein ELB75_12090 [Eikenella corrodens]